MCTVSIALDATDTLHVRDWDNVQHLYSWEVWELWFCITPPHCNVHIIITWLRIALNSCAAFPVFNSANSFISHGSGVKHHRCDIPQSYYCDRCQGFHRPTCDIHTSFTHFSYTWAIPCRCTWFLQQHGETERDLLQKWCRSVFLYQSTYDIHCKSIVVWMVKIYIGHPMDSTTPWIYIWCCSASAISA